MIVNYNNKYFYPEFFNTVIDSRRSRIQVIITSS